MRYCKRYILIACCSLLLYKIPAQVLPVKHYSAADGLSSNVIKALYQDKRNIIWVGTNNGLNWFDGTHFYAPPILPKTGQLYIVNIKNDDSDNIWLCTYYNGLYKYADNRFENFLPDPVNLSSGANNVFDIVQWSDSEYIVATDYSVFFLMEKNLPRSILPIPVCAARFLLLPLLRKKKY